MHQRVTGRGGLRLVVRRRCDDVDLVIAGYEQLRRVAERAGDDETAAAALGILAQERGAAERLAGAFREAAAASLDAQNVS